MLHVGGWADASRAGEYFSGWCSVAEAVKLGYEMTLAACRVVRRMREKARIPGLWKDRERGRHSF